MPAAAPLTGQFYQWSATSPPIVARPEPAPLPAPTPAPAVVAASERQPGRLTDRLNLKLGELRLAGYEIRWITASMDDLTTLLREGGDQAILMDPNPSSDVAWYGRYEIRPSADPMVRIYIEGEFDEISCHIV